MPPKRRQKKSTPAVTRSQTKKVKGDAVTKDSSKPQEVIRCSVTDSEQLSQSLLESLPNDPNEMKAAASEMLKGFRLVELGIQKRMTAQLQRASSEATVPMCGVAVPAIAILRIFGYLDQDQLAYTIPLVSKAFRQLSLSPSLWRELEKDTLRYGYRGDCQTFSAFLALLRRPQFSELQRLTIPPWAILTEATAKDLVQAAPHLKSLDLTFITVTTPMANHASLIVSMRAVINFCIL